MSEAKTNYDSCSEEPWMADGARLTPKVSELLPKLVKLTKKVTEQLRLLASEEDEKLTETSLYNVICPYDQATALGKTNIDVDHIAVGFPCCIEGFLLMYARWRKLERYLYNERKDWFNITQIPDVYDSCKKGINMPLRILSDMRTLSAYCMVNTSKLESDMQTFHHGGEESRGELLSKTSGTHFYTDTVEHFQRSLKLKVSD